MIARLLVVWLLGLLLLSACGQRAEPQPFTGIQVEVSTSVAALNLAQPCTGSFATHDLDFTTTVRGDTIHLFDSNGAGVAAGDLNDDGRPDLVFANLDGPDTIFWNMGNFAFRKEELDDRNSRAVNIVDTDGDGKLDIVFSHRAAGISVWHNTGDGHFERRTLPGVLAPAYAMAWGDFSDNGTLDLVTGSYNTELQKMSGSAALLSDNGGVYYYARQADRWVGQRLAPAAQALAIALPDLNGDGKPDIVVGNDFTMRDAAWLRTGEGWSPTAGYSITTESTMSFDQADIDNSGQMALFATDMKPADNAVRTFASWLPMMATMPQTMPSGDPQIMANVLQVRGNDGGYHNEAFERGIDATGWSWSGKFGDLDNDGYVDLYVVNGMIARELFKHLPHDELVEPNQARRNDGTGHFEAATQWGLGSLASGRGMTMVDLNGDGKLDIVVNNLRAPAQIFENRVCGGAGMEVELRWPQRLNSRAIGAQLMLYTSAGTYLRDVRAGSGYLSGDAPQVHFGIPANATLNRLDIRWPDGQVSTISAPTRAALTITRR